MNFCALFRAVFTVQLSVSVSWLKPLGLLQQSHYRMTAKQRPHHALDSIPLRHFWRQSNVISSLIADVIASLPHVQHRQRWRHQTCGLPLDLRSWWRRLRLRHWWWWYLSQVILTC